MAECQGSFQKRCEDYPQFSSEINGIVVQAVCIHLQKAMDLEKTISEIEWLERIFSLPDRRPLRMQDREAANQRHDELLAENPWFRLWKRYGV